MNCRHSGAVATMAAAGLAVSLLLTACNSSTSAASPTTAAGRPSSASASPSGPASAINASVPVTVQTKGAASACSLITEADVARIVGADPGKGRAFRSHGATQCQYGSLPKQILLVNVTPGLGRAAYDQIRNNPNLSAGNKLSVTKVAGIGDEAFELSGPHTDAVYFTNGAALVVVGFSSGTSPPKGGARALAKIGAGRF